MSSSRTFPVKNYNLALTLNSGQAFRWSADGDAWIGVIGSRWVRLSMQPSGIWAEAAEPQQDWAWLSHYLQVDQDLDAILRTFPKDEPMQNAVRACHGLRLLRQEPWECLASFILSSTKQIVQIRQVIAAVCARFGTSLLVPPGCKQQQSFPSPERLAAATESELRACKMGFRAGYLLKAARDIAEGRIDLTRLGQLPVEQAREELVMLHGVGKKIANCVLLFAYDFQNAFPIDVWVLKALRELYFPRRGVKRQRLENFCNSYFGPHSGYAQQYLFHYMRTRRSQSKTAGKED